MAEPDGAKNPVSVLGDVLVAIVQNIKDPAILGILGLVIAFDVVVVVAFAGDRWALAICALVSLAAVALVGKLAQARSERRVRRLGETAVTGQDTYALLNALGEEDLRYLNTVLARAASDASSLLGVAPSEVRANIFAMDSTGKLRIPRGLTHNMDRPEEVELTLDVGKGSSGLAFASGHTYIAVLRSDWGDAALPDTDLAKLHPGLRWIISVPVLSGHPDPVPVLVLNIDGLSGAPPLAELQLVAQKMTHWGQFVCLAVAAIANPKEDA